MDADADGDGRRRGEETAAFVGVCPCPIRLLKSGTSIGANYREANRAESRDDFIHKIALVEKEAAETQYWLELFEEAGEGNPDERRWLLQESGELLAIFTSIGKTSKARR